MTVKQKILFIPGLPRCGTTAICQILAQDPLFYLPKIKEPHFFLPRKNELYAFTKTGERIHDLSKQGFLPEPLQFERLLRQCPTDKVFIEGSTLYCAHPESFNEIARFPSIEPYFLILTRDPFDRALSHYLYSQARDEEPSSFRIALEEEISGKRINWILGGYISGSDPAPAIKKILSVWGPTRLFTGDMRKQNLFSNEFLNEILKFLQLPSFNFEIKKTNELQVVSGFPWRQLRIFAKQFRQINPLLLDNQLTRKLFQLFMRFAPKNKDLRSTLVDEREFYEIWYKKLCENHEST